MKKIHHGLLRVGVGFAPYDQALSSLTADWKIASIQKFMDEIGGVILLILFRLTKFDQKRKQCQS